MPPNDNKSARKAARTARLEEELRANLVRRKQRARAQAASAESDNAAQPAPVKTLNEASDTENL